MVCKDENEDESEDDEEGERKEDDVEEGVDEFSVSGVESDNHKRGEVGLEEEEGVHCRWREIDNEWEWEEYS